MPTTTFTELRRRAKKYFNAVEQGETVNITRRGSVIAKIVPAETESQPLWKSPALRLKIKGASLSAAVLVERGESNK